ncbi:Retrovirus-related Pol polyprotein from transposon RE1 [Vitis vinifera]|uniref:Retrovirus-related Pol polyprotein from transposon RE1 n=1 Tax=Vitis vinifera TaxID=29760 RepID=A0A438DVG8_VITVI|nr:Retrovirus-related Pol polyprotein from transposon RE1 [Vitis vinifera]
MSETRPFLTSDYLDVAMFESTPCFISNPSHNTEGHLNLGGDMELQTNRETLVYSRRPKSKFNETLISEALQESESVIVPTPREYDFNSDQVTDDLPIAIRKQPRSCTLHPISNFVSYNSLSAKCRAFTTNLDRIQLPKNIQEAFEIPEWKEAVMEEIRALEKNETWEVMNLPRGKKPVGLAKLNTIRVLFSLAANLDWPLHQFDIKNAFLNGELEEEVFMMLPPGFYKEEEETRVCKLKKSLYGLKQSPRAWFDRFAKVIKNQGYQQGQSDHTMFFKQSNDGRMTILIVYVDDIILTGDDTGEVERLKKVLATEFEVKDLGQMRYFLGMEVARSRKGISISQRKYVLDLLTETGMLGCKPSDTPIKARNRMESDGKPVDREKYQRLVGRLIYLSHTRPDIAFAVSVVSQYMHSPKESHLEAVYKILRYLKGSPGRGLFFKKSDSKKVEIYTDADWAGSADDRRSTTGYCTYVWGNLVTWRSKKQSVVARSSAEAEFRAVAQGMCEGLWLKKLLEELCITIELPIKLYCDNKAAISISHNPVQHNRTKHIEVDRHFIKEKFEKGIICMTYIPTREQLADIFTKGLQKSSFEDFMGKLDMINIYDPT